MALFDKKIAKLESKLATANPKKAAKLQQKLLNKREGKPYQRAAMAEATADMEAARQAQEADRTFMEGKFKELEGQLGQTPAAPTFSQSPFKLRSAGGVRRKRPSRKPTGLSQLRIQPTAVNTGGSGGGLNIA